MLAAQHAVQQGAQRKQIRALVQRLKSFANTRDVSDSFSRGKRQLDFRLRPEGRRLGLTSEYVGMQLRDRVVDEHVPHLAGVHVLRHDLRHRLQHLAAARDRGDAWFTTPGAIRAHVDALAAVDPAAFA